MGNCPSKRGNFPAKLGLDQEERELQEALRVQAMNDVGKYPEIWDRIQQGISVQWHYLKNKCLKNQLDTRRKPERAAPGRAGRPPRRRPKVFPRLRLAGRVPRPPRESAPALAEHIIYVID